MGFAISGWAETLSAHSGVSFVCDDRTEYRTSEATRKQQDAARGLRKESEKIAAEREAREPKTPSAPAVRFDLKYGLLPSQVDHAIARGRRAGDIGHRTVAFYLADCADRGIYQEFGHSSVIPYAMKRHHISRRQARDLIAAGRALRDLQKIDLAFIQDDLPWSKVRAIARVAEPATEDNWLAFAKLHPIEVVEREAALAKKGENPREDRKGIPETRFNVRLRITTLLHEQFLLARQKLGTDLGHDASDEEITGALLDAFLRVPPESASGHSLYQVVLDMNPANRSAAIRSEDGPTPVDDATAESICCDAGVLGTDGQRVAGHAPPIPDGLRRRILARDGHRCKVCGAGFQLHVHHIVWRSEHGSNAYANLMATCVSCHTLIHNGFLVIEGAAPNALAFRDRDGTLLSDPAKAVLGPQLALAIEPAPGGAAAPCVSGFAAGKVGVFQRTLPRQVDARWIDSRRHLISWDTKRTVLDLEPGQPVDPAPEAADETVDGDGAAENPTRPATFDDIVGQKAAIACLKIAAEAFRNDGSMPDPILLLGAPGLGKTTLARAFARELGARLTAIDGAMLDNVLTLVDHLLNLKDRDVVFIDEIHAIPTRLGEALYQAIEDGAIDLPFSDGRRTKSVRFVLPKVTFIAATTSPDLMPEPLVARFPIREELDPYSVEELAEIVQRAARRERISVPKDAAVVLAKASGGCARTAIGLYKRMKAALVAKRKPAASADDARTALASARLDQTGLGPVHRRVLDILARHGRPMAIRRVARASGVSVGAFRTLYEPALIELGLIVPTARGLVIATG